MADVLDTVGAQQVGAGADGNAPHAEATPRSEAEDRPAASEGQAEAGVEVSADYSGLRLPAGYRADDPVFGEAMKLFGSEKIAPETAQKLIDFTVERDREIARAVNDHAASSWMKQTTE